MKWVTTDNLTLERFACPWLITRFIDQKAELLFVSEDKIDETIKETAAIPFDMKGVEFSSDNSFSAFGKFLLSYRFNNPALSRMATLLDSMDVDKWREELTKIGRNELVDLFNAILSSGKKITCEEGMKLYDALYAHIKSQQELPERWEPKTKVQNKLF